MRRKPEEVEGLSDYNVIFTSFEREGRLGGSLLDCHQSEEGYATGAGSP